MTDLTKPTRVAHINVIVEVPDDITAERVEVDITAALNGTHTLNGQRSTRVFLAGTWHPTPRFVWRGSNASAEILKQFVDTIDDNPRRAGGSYTSVSTDFEGYSIGGVRTVTSAVCTVDAYDGRHFLHPGDALVMTVDGWTVEAAS